MLADAAAAVVDAVTQADPEVVVIGAGPAGAGTALRLAERGIDVCLVERQPLPRAKVCGGCLHQRGVRLLQAWGADEVLTATGASTLRGSEVVAGGATMVWPRSHGVVVDRTAFDAALVDRAKRAGVVIRDGVPAHVTAPRRDGQWAVRIGSDNPRWFKSIVVADGLGGSSLAAVPGFEVARDKASNWGMGASIDATLGLERGIVRMHCGANGYLGAVRNPAGGLELAAAISPQVVKSCRGPSAAAAQLLSDTGAPDTWHRAAAAARWRLTAPLTAQRRRVAAPGLFVVGDSAGYVEPFTGEGITWSLRGAQHAARLVEAMLQGDLTLRAAANAWSRWVFHQRWVAQARCRVARRVLRHPAAVRKVVQFGASARRLFAPRIAAPGSTGAAA